MGEAMGCKCRVEEKEARVGLPLIDVQLLYGSSYCSNQLD